MLRYMVSYQQIIVLHVNTTTVSVDLVDGEAGPRHEEVVTWATESGQDKLDGLSTARRYLNILAIR